MRIGNRLVADDPGIDVVIVLVQQGFERIELGLCQARADLFDEGTQDKVGFAEPATPRPEGDPAQFFVRSPVGTRVCVGHKNPCPVCQF